MSPSIPDRWARLDAFLKKLQGDVYPEPANRVHTDVTREAFAEVMRHGPFPAGARVLDVGCGQGLALELFQAAGLEAVGIGLGPDVEVCRAKGLDVREMDLTFLEFPDASFDLVWCRHAIEHSIMPFFTLSELRRIVRPGGLVYLEVPAPETAAHHEANRNHYSVLGKAMWTQLMRRAGFPSYRPIDFDFKSAAGPDTYWGFILQAP